MRADTRLITAPGWTEAPDASGHDGNNRVVRLKSAGATVPVGRAHRPSPPRRPLSLPQSLGVIGRHPHLSARREGAAVASPLGRQAATAQPGDTTMSSRTTTALAAAIVLGTALTASAATLHRGTGHADPATYNTGGPIATGNAGGTITTGYCPPSGGPSCSTACLPSGPPCKPGHDTW